MPTFELSDAGGGKYRVEAPDETSALSAFQELTGTKTAKEPISADNVVRSAARGVPIVGGLLDRANAATNATLSPVVEPFLTPNNDSLTPEGGWAARYAKSLELQRTKDKNFDAEHPIVSTAAKIGGGVGAFGGAIKAVPALAGPLGFEGTLPQMVTKGALSGAAISGADEAVRGEDPVHGAEIGAITGAVGGPVGRLIGKGVSKVAGAFRPTPALTHAETVPVAGVDIPVPNTDPVAASKIEIARRGAAGAPAQRVIQTGDEATQAALERAKGNIGTDLDPAAGVRPPQNAAAQVAEELQGLEQQRFQTEQNARQRVVAATEELRHSLDTSRPNLAQAHDNTGVPRAEAVQPVPGASGGAEQPILPAMPRGQYEGVAQSPSLGVRPGEGQLPELRGGLPAARQVEEAALRLRGAEQPNASPGLRPAPAGGVDVPPLSSGAPRAEAPLGVPSPDTVAPPVAARGPQIHAESPLAASEVLAAGIQRKAEEAAAARSAAYAAKAAIPGEYDRAALGASGNAIRKDLSSGPIEHQVRITQSTPKATEALQLIDETIGGAPSQGLPNAAIPLEKPALEPLTGETVEGVRKALNQIYGDALRSARGPGGNATDARAVGRIIDAFDKHITNVEKAGGFSGDAKALAEARDAARASHVAYKTTFEPRNPGDAVGKNVEKIVGKFDGQEAGHDQIMFMSYGPASEPGGSAAAQMAQRFKEVFGANSKEYAAYKQGLLSHLVDNPDGTPRAAAEAADRIEKFLKAPKGKILSQVALTAEERAAFANHVETLRAAEPVALKDLGTVDKVIARITGRDGGPPASLADVTDYFFGPNSGKRGLQFQLATRLKRDLSPDGFNALRVGMWSKLTGVTEGKTDLTAKRLSDNLFEFLNGHGSDLAKVLYLPTERTEMLRLAQAVKSHIPLAGSTNPSGTAPMMAKIAAKIGHGILPTVGLMHGGIPGAIVGAVADKGVTAVSNARAAREAGLLFYGRQPKVGTDIDLAKAAAVLSRGAAQG